MPGETVLVIDDSPTILKVVQLVLTKARYQVETAADGEAGLELARSKKPALILLDFVMPRMNGYQFCREMADDPELKDIPIVLMSAKGDQVGERFVKVMGIVDYITKPFSPEAITAVVQHTITKYARRSPDTGDELLAGSYDLDSDDETASEELARKADEAKSEAIERFRNRVVDILQRHAESEITSVGGDDPDGLPPAIPNVATLASAALDDVVLTELITSAAPAVTGATRTPSLRGDVRVVPVAEVLQLLDVQQQSGILAVEQGNSRLEVYYRKGLIDLAVATGVDEEFLLGRFIVDNELMSKEDFDGFLEARSAGTKLIGAQLVKLGYISEKDLKTALKKQTCELVYELLRWRFGTFDFVSTRELPFPAVDAALGLDVEAILMEGFRRVDEWHLIEREVDNFELVFLRNEDALAQMGRGRLTREELAIIELVNGKNTVKDIIRRSRMGSFDVSKMLYRLLSIKLIRRRVMPVAV